MLFASSATANYPFKMLHIGFHKGCLKDIEEVGKELGIEITSWWILESVERRADFEGIDVGNRVYNMSHDRAEKVWQRHKEYFNQFDVIMTSDTAPLARIFLQNGWEKPLIIWVCNRFDYRHDNSDPFPDAEFYDLFRSAMQKKNVILVPWSAYEYVYASQKQVYFGTNVIKPIGSKPNANKKTRSSIPKFVKKEETLFIYPRLEEFTIESIKKSCTDIGIKTYSGPYDSPDELTAFKGIIYVPYQWSNMALFENIQRGIVHFVPTAGFLRNFTIFSTYDFHYLSEWYCDENQDLFVYFNSWEDLKNKVATTNFEEKRAYIRARANKGREDTLIQWRQIFDEVVYLHQQKGC